MLYRLCCFLGQRLFAPLHIRSYQAISACGLFIFGLLLVCCAGEGANNTANSNLNISVKTVNTPYVSNANTMPPTIDNSSLKAALKDRLHSDASNVLTEDDWGNDAWLDMPVGRFYDNDPDFSKDAVCLATIQLLKQANLKLTDASKKTLRAGVTEKTPCKTAVSKMLDATLKTNPIIGAL